MPYGNRLLSEEITFNSRTCAAMQLRIIGMGLLLVVGQSLGTTDAADKQKTEITEQVRQFGTPRARAPAKWPGFDWPKKRGILFGQYAPTAEEQQLIEEALPAEATAQPQAARKLLVFYRCQYPHASIATGVFAFDMLGKTTGAFEATLSDDPADFTQKNLAEYDAVLLNNTTSWDKTLDKAGREALLDFVASGNGLIGIHAAADSCKGWRPGQELIGGVFQCHPWTANGTWAFQLESPEHPLNAAFANQGFWLRDEVYYYRNGTHTPGRSRVIVALDMSKSENLDGPQMHQEQKHLANPEQQHPVAWLHSYGEGRVFYSNLGHNNTTYWQPKVLQHYLDGIQFALGDLEVDMTPSAEIPKLAIAPAPSRE